MADPAAVARVLAEIVGVDPTGDAWLADLRGFDGAERAELCDALRSEGVLLVDRSKLRRLITAAAALPPPLEVTTRGQNSGNSRHLWFGAARPTMSPAGNSKAAGTAAQWTPSPWSSPILVTALLGIASYLVQARQAQAASAAQHRLGRELAEREKAEQNAGHQLTRLQ